MNSTNAVAVNTHAVLAGTASVAAAQPEFALAMSATPNPKTTALFVTRTPERTNYEHNCSTVEKYWCE